VSTGRARAAGRGAADRIETEADAFFERVRQAYRERAEAEPQRFHVIDASQSPDNVLQAAIAAVDHVFEANS
jgi:dTMP kinase